MAQDPHRVRGLGLTARGDTFLQRVNAYGNLSPGLNGRVLTMSAGTPAWAAPAAGSITAGTTNLLPKYTDGINSVLGASGISDTGTIVSTAEILDLSTSSSVVLPSNTNAKGLNKTLYADQFPGADMCAKINAAADSSPWRR